MAKYVTINKYHGKISKRTTEDLALAKDRCEKGGKVILKLSSNKHIIIFDKK
jgi:hypothetical protein